MKTLRRMFGAAAVLALVITVMATTSVATAQDGGDACSGLNDQQRRYFQSIGACQQNTGNTGGGGAGAQQTNSPDDYRPTQLPTCSPGTGDRQFTSGVGESPLGGITCKTTHAGRHVEYVRSTSQPAYCPTGGIFIQLEHSQPSRFECAAPTACPSGSFLMLLPIYTRTSASDSLHWPWVCDSPSNLVNCPAGQGLNCSDSPTWRANPATPEREDLQFNGYGTDYNDPNYIIYVCLSDDCPNGPEVRVPKPPGWTRYGN